jgi:hypothetical protein
LLIKKRKKYIHMIDSAIHNGPNNEKIQWKVSKQTDLKIEPRDLRKLNNDKIIPLTVSTTGLAGWY